VQAFRNWSPPAGTLGRLTGEAHARAATLEPQREALERAALAAPAPPSFASALRAAKGVAVIAEVKRRSPSKGWISQSLGAAAQAVIYERGGASAVSVLTEPDSFGGSLDDLWQVVAAVAIPALRKDFLVHPLQLAEARIHGAAAVLLIARSLSPDELPRLADSARDMGLEILVEIRDEAELERALDCRASVIGVNNRNLETLEIDPATCDRIIPMIPGGVIAVAESGMRSRADVERAAAAGADAVLVGSVLSGADDAASALAGLVSVTRGAPRRD
jgi:indole-3-glycerol phosphate synthase